MKQLLGFTFFMFSLCFYSFADVNHSNKQDENAYRRFVEFISYEVRGNKTLARIQLSDQSTWNYIVDAFNEARLLNIEQDFYPGNEVFAMAKDRSEKYVLAVQNKNGLKVGYQVGLTKETKQNLPRLARVEKLTMVEGGWFTKAVYGYRFFLTDGSVWFAGPSAKGIWSIEEWKAGDYILITRSIFDYWNLINTDASCNSIYNGLDYRIISWVEPAGAPHHEP